MGVLTIATLVTTHATHAWSSIGRLTSSTGAAIRRAKGARATPRCTCRLLLGHLLALLFFLQFLFRFLWLPIILSVARSGSPGRQSRRVLNLAQGMVPSTPSSM